MTVIDYFSKNLFFQPISHYCSPFFQFYSGFHKNSCKIQKSADIAGTLLQNEFTIDKYQKEIDSKCFSLKNYVNNAIVKYCMIPNEMYVVGYILRLNLLLVARYFLFVALYFLLHYSLVFARCLLRFAR